MSKKWLRRSLCVIAVLIFCFGVFTGWRAWSFKNTLQPQALSDEQKSALYDFVVSNYSEKHQILKKLPYNIEQPSLEVWANSAILVDVSNGSVLYEKNADTIIPPASMTKLFSMYVVEEEVAAGHLSYDQLIPLPPESWACNMPPHSSLMFLGKDQRVTLEELLLGLSICSGNDAAYALAFAACGSMEAFVERMNFIASSLGLEKTHFVESSGYSELNKTTAREMAKFCIVYLRRHPDSLRRYHGVLSFTYPKEKNLAPGDVLKAQDFTQGFPEKITMPITQQNTNPLLGKLSGCDGLKTGYIDESGYNLALTAVRDETRFLSVTMGGPGKNVKEGQAGRVHDGTELMEWAFRHFADYSLELKVHPYNVHSFNASEKMIRLVPAYNDKTIAVPKNLENTNVEVKLPAYSWGSVERGEVLGTIEISAGGYLLDEIPLVADRSLKKGNIFTAASDLILKRYKNTIKDR